MTRSLRRAQTSSPFKASAAIGIAALVVLPSLTFPSAAQTTAKPSLTLHCAGRLVMGKDLLGGGPDLAFAATIPFGVGHFVALSVPETDRIERLLYDAEVQVGSIQLASRDASEMVWTRATGLRASVVGLAIGPAGDVTSLTVHGAATGSSDRSFDFFDTAAGSAYQGTCRPTE